MNPFFLSQYPIGTKTTKNNPSQNLAKSTMDDSVLSFVDWILNEISFNEKSIRDKIYYKGNYPKTELNIVEKRIGSGEEIMSFEKFLKFDFAVPGINPEDILINFDENNASLSISYEKKKENESKNESQERNISKVLSEITHSSFSRTWCLDPNLLDLKTCKKEIDCELRNGMLTVYIPMKNEVKKEEKNDEKIKIKIKT